MDRHINIIGILWIVYGAIGIFFALFMFLLMFGLSFIPDVGSEGAFILRTIGTGFAIFMGILSLPEIFAGYGLIKGQEWGRILTLILSFLNLINVPLGTALAVYSFVILIKEESVQHFQKKKK